MNGLLNIVSTASTLPTEQFIQLLNGFEAHQTFNQKSINELDAVVALITSYLNSNDKKYEGLLLLHTFLKQCQLDLIEQKGNLWLSLCVKICGTRGPTAQVNLSYSIISMFVAKSIHLPDLGKTISSNHLSKIIEGIVEQPIECQLAAIKCLECCMKHYAGPCGASRGIIERFLVSFVDGHRRSLVLQGGKCLHQLQQIRGGTVQGLSQKNAWNQYQEQLLGSLHAALNQIYANITETYDGYHFDDTISTLKIPELNLSAEPIQRATQLIVRFQNLCDLLRIALGEPFPVSKAIKPGLILSLIARGLAVNCTTLAKNLIVDNVAIGALLPMLHTTLFNLLDTLILVLRTNLLPFTNDLCQMAIQSLKWTSSGRATGFQRPYSAIRQSTYRTLSLWCKTIKHGSLVESIADDLIKQIIFDATPFQSEVTLKVLTGSRKYLSKKARQRLNKAQNEASNIVQTHSKAFNPHNTKIVYSDDGNEALCTDALKCFIDVLNAAGCFLNPTHQKILQENIVSLALATINTVPKSSNLYARSSAREALYDALYALVQCPQHLCAPPLQYALEVYRIAQTSDIDKNIRLKCGNHLRAIEKTLHPQKETFYFPTDVNEMNEAFERHTTCTDANIGDDSDSEDEEMAPIECEIERPQTPGPTVDGEQIEDVIDSTNMQVEQPSELIESPQVPTIKAEEAAQEKSIEINDSSSEDKQAEVVLVESAIMIDSSSESVADSEDRALKSPPRKSARLSAKRRLSASIDSPTVRSDSPSLRRRTRRNSNSQQDTPTMDNLVVSLSPISESQQTNENKFVVEENETDMATEKIDELASAFIEEFVEEFVDE